MKTAIQILSKAEGRLILTQFDVKNSKDSFFAPLG
jgi:hypothetical protein